MEKKFFLFAASFSLFCIAGIAGPGKCWSNKDFKGSYEFNFSGPFGPPGAFASNTENTVMRTGVLVADGEGHYVVHGPVNFSGPTINTLSVEDGLCNCSYFVHSNGKADVLCSFTFGDISASNVKGEILLTKGGKAFSFAVFSDSSRTDYFAEAQVQGAGGKQ